MRITRSVVARQADNEKTNKRRTKDEQMTVRAARADEQMTNNKYI
ncbi:hypothetical protein [Capnocytophaga sp. oral taxon 864]|nr:hypothetical protein [Capnocytophaga sp. oral taxon 864]